MTYEEMEAKVAEQKKAVIELNKRIILRLNELGLKEFHFSDFYGDGECSWCDEEIDSDIVKIYETQEQKDLVVVDTKNIKIEHVNKPLIKIENDKIRHDNMKLALEIMNILVK